MHVFLNPYTRIAFLILFLQTTLRWQKGKSDLPTSKAEPEEIDPYVIFAVMLGSHLVEPYIGELRVANTADSLMKDAANQQFGNMEAMKKRPVQAYAKATSEEATFKQHKREVKFELHLRSRIAPG